jgi:hypothetical protein
MAVLRNLIVRAGGDFSPLQREMRRTQTQMRDFGRTTETSMRTVSRGVENFRGGFERSVMGLAEALGPETMGISIAVGALVTAVTGGVESAMELETSIAQINNTLGQSAEDFRNWANVVGASFGYSEKDAMSAGATYSNLITGFSDGTEQVKQRTEDLMKATAVISSRTGRSMEDVTERIRSGLLGNTEAIEDLGVNVNIAMITSTNAFKKLANGKHWAQLNFKTQQQIRLMAILEQTNKKYGNSLADTATTAMQRMKAEWSNMVSNFGSMFLPVVKVVFNGLAGIFHFFATITKFVSTFVKALFGYKDPPIATNAQTKNIKNQTGAVNNLSNAIKGVGKAKKQANQSLAGIDEINNLSSGSGSSGSLGGGNNPFGDIGQQADDATEKVGKVSDKVQLITKGIGDIGKGFHDILTGNFKKGLKEIGDGIGEIATAVFGAKGKKYIWDGLGDIKKGLSDIVKGNFKKGLSEIGTGLHEILNGMVGKKKGDEVWSGLTKVKNGLHDIMKGNFSQGLHNIGAGMKSIYNALGGKTLTSLIKGGIISAVNMINDVIDSIDVLISRMQDWSVAGKHPFGGLKMIPSIRVPKFAQGGVVNKATLGIFGEAGKEAIMPLERNTGWINELASKINNLNGGSDNGGGNTEIYLQLNEVTLGKVVIGAINKVHRKGGKVLLNI